MKFMGPKVLGILNSTSSWSIELASEVKEKMVTMCLSANALTKLAVLDWFKEISIRPRKVRYAPLSIAETLARRL
jgi:hypothetical protein